MPYKLHVNLKSMSHQSSVIIQEDDGHLMHLKHVKRVVVTGDAEGPPMVELTMYSPDFEGEVVISDATAEVIMLQERARQLSFIGGAEAIGLIAWRKRVGEVMAGLGYAYRDAEISDGTVVAFDAIDKIIAVLVKRDGIG